MELPDKNQDYQDQRYWDERYKKEEHYDWFTAYRSFRHLVLQTVRPPDRLLMLGKVPRANIIINAECFVAD